MTLLAVPFLSDPNGATRLFGDANNEFNGAAIFTGRDDGVRNSRLYAIELEEGQTYYIEVESDFEDAIVEIRHSLGYLLQSDTISLDPSLPTARSFLTFTAAESGLHYIEVSEFVAGSIAATDIGRLDFFLVDIEESSRHSNVPATFEEIAQELVQTNGSGENLRLDVGNDGEITYSTLTNQFTTLRERAVLETVFQQITAVTGINFRHVNSGNGDIDFIFSTRRGVLFDPASANADGIVPNSEVYTHDAFFTPNIATTAILYALGLQTTRSGRGADPFEVGDTDASLLSDSELFTILSPNSGEDVGRQLTEARPQTIQYSDILALQQIYGPNTQPFNEEDTTYFFHASPGLAFPFAIDAENIDPSRPSPLANVSLTIYDEGGSDWLDLSGFTDDQIIDLRPLKFSSVGGSQNNLVASLPLFMGRSRLIENALGGSGNDILYGNEDRNTLYGLSGNDTLYGFGDVDFLIGGDDSDNVFGGDGNDYIYGHESTAVADFYDGGDGIDFVLYHLASSIREGVTVDLSGQDTAPNNQGRGTRGQAQFDIYKNIEGVVGTNLVDFITGDSQTNHLYGVGGNDQIFGGDGIDVLWGGDGFDTVSGEEGRDFLIAHEAVLSQDTYRGGPGTDVISYAQAEYAVVIDLTITVRQTDLSLSDRGQSQLFTNAEVRDRIADVEVRLDEARRNINAAQGDLIQQIEDVVGSPYSDFIYGDNIANTLWGGDGNDFLHGLDGDDSLYGEEGDDFLVGGEGNDILFGGLGSDIVQGGPGRDYILAEELELVEVLPSGERIFRTQRSADVYDGGLGYDVISYHRAMRGVVVDLNQTFQLPDDRFNGGSSDSAVGDQLTNIEAIVGTPFDDDISAGDILNSYINLNGERVELGNVLYGREGDDILTGGIHRDFLYGEDGSDTVAGGGGSDYLYAHEGNDKGNDRYFGFELSSNSDDSVDFVSYALSNSNVFVDLIVGGQTPIGVQGRADSTGDTYTGIEGIVGSPFDDFLLGDDNNNTIYGGDGADHILGRGGQDHLIGGDGPDVFIFEDNHGTNQILDFEPGEDRIVIISTTILPDDLIIEDITDGSVSFAQISANNFSTIIKVMGRSASELIIGQNINLVPDFRLESAALRDETLLELQDTALNYYDEKVAQVDDNDWETTQPSDVFESHYSNGNDMTNIYDQQQPGISVGLGRIIDQAIHQSEDMWALA